MSSESQPAVVRDYAGLRAAIAARRHELGFSQLEVDYRSGCHDGYQGKLECGVKNFGDMSLPCVLGALGLELVVRPATGDGKK